MSQDSVILTKSLKFAARIVKLYQYLSMEKHETVISKQIIRSGTSIGANANEAVYGVSKAEFRLSALNSTGLDVVKVRFIGQRKLYNNGTVKVVPLCIRRKQQANPSRRP